MRLDRIYTRGGDAGATSLGDGARTPKHSLRIAALGDLDETNAALGVALAYVGGAGAGELLARIQNDLFDLGADLCRPARPDDAREPLRLIEAQVEALEAAIDAAVDRLAPLASFILPGGSVAAAHLHLARTVARRAERAVSALAAAEPVNPVVLRYLNRLSDLLFVMAREANDGGRSDVLWRPGGNR